MKIRIDDDKAIIKFKNIFERMYFIEIVNELLERSEVDIKARIKFGSVYITKSCEVKFDDEESSDNSSGRQSN